MANLREVAREVERRSVHKFARGTVVLPLPVYEGQYAARFGVLGAERLAEFERVGETYTIEQNMEACADVIAEACRQILGRGKAGGKYEELTHDDGRPVLFDVDFAEALDLPAPPGKDKHEGLSDVVMACWTSDDGEIITTALNAFAVKLIGWMTDTARAVEGEIAGESLATRQSETPAAPPSLASLPT
jgi:hypothetical protein